MGCWGVVSVDLRVRVAEEQEAWRSAAAFQQLHLDRTGARGAHLDCHTRAGETCTRSSPRHPSRRTCRAVRCNTTIPCDDVARILPTAEAALSVNAVPVYAA